MHGSDWILAVETSGQRGGVALARGARLLETRELSGDRRHAAELLPVVAEILKHHGCAPAALGVFCYSHGPGSFTGLRIAATMARMLMATTGCRVVAAPTLEVIARNALHLADPPQRVVALIDAKGQQAYAAEFAIERCGAEGVARLHPVQPAALVAVGDFLAKLPRPLVVMGPGVARHRTTCEANGCLISAETLWQPRAAEVIAVARPLIDAERFQKPQEVLPLYLRPPECEQVYEQRREEARRKAAAPD